MVYNKLVLTDTFTFFSQSLPLLKLCVTQKITQLKSSNDFWSLNDMK